MMTRPSGYRSLKALMQNWEKIVFPPPVTTRTTPLKCFSQMAKAFSCQPRGSTFGVQIGGNEVIFGDINTMLPESPEGTLDIVILRLYCDPVTIKFFRCCPCRVAAPERI